MNSLVPPIEDFEVLTAIVIHQRVFVTDLLGMVSPRPLETLVDQVERLEELRLIVSQVAVSPMPDAYVLVRAFTKSGEMGLA